VASAEAVLGGARKSLEKASLVQVLRWNLEEMGIYEARLSAHRVFATTDEFKHL